VQLGGGNVIDVHLVVELQLVFLAGYLAKCKTYITLISGTDC
jgi:hypothetical protein